MKPINLLVLGKTSNGPHIMVCPLMVEAGPWILVVFRVKVVGKVSFTMTLAAVIALVFSTRMV